MINIWWIVDLKGENREDWGKKLLKNKLLEILLELKNMNFWIEGFICDLYI